MGRFSHYVNAAMRRAKYELLPNDKTFFARIPGFQGVWANADTLEQCRTELQEVLEEWIMLRIADRLALPAAGKVRLDVARRKRVKVA
jgi:predicted RNase H-like HicB family nuclease